MSNQNRPTEAPTPQPETPTEENTMVKKRIFGRGIYGSKDVPIRVLDTCIALMIVAAVLLVIIGARGAGFTVQFDTGLSDVMVEQQKIRHGEKAAEPEPPLRPGYSLVGWSTTPAPEVNLWDFSARAVQNDLTLYAVWRPAEVTVKLDAGEGTVSPDTLTVTYGESYGDLPTPAWEGKTFAGWLYSGQTITADTPVTMTGEHVLQAVWQ